MSEEHLINLQPGTLIAGRYEVVKCIGAGSMGVAYACRYRELGGHLVGVKVLYPEVAQDKVAAARFRNEICASYRVSHPNVVRAFEYIRDGDLVAYTMEYVGGGDLAAKIGRGKAPLAISEIVKILSQMCAGVQAIHDAGIVHRDLKPENILLTKEGAVKIADFGIARVDRGQKLTEHGGVVGTIDYVSPEYMLKSQVDWRSDIYAMGILAYEMITGELPFRGDSVYAAMTKRLKSDPKPPSQLRSECSADLDAIILKMMSRNPEERYQSAAEIFSDITRLAAKLGIQTSGVYLTATSVTDGRYVGPSLEPTESGPEALESLVSLADEQQQAQPASVSKGHIISSGAHGPRVMEGGQYAAMGAGAGGGMHGAASHSDARNARQNNSSAITGPDPARYSGVNRNSESTKARTDPSGVEDLYERGYASSDVHEGLQRDYQIPGPDYMASEAYQQPSLNDPTIKTKQSANYENDNKQSWVPQGVSDTPTISANNDNLRKLSQMSEQTPSTLWVDVILLIATVVIGLGFGFACVNFLFPANSNGVQNETSISSGLGAN